MSCYTTPIIDSIKGRYPSYTVNDEKGEIFIPVGSKYKTLDQTYMVAQRLYNEVGKQYGKYGHMSSLYTQDNGTLLKIHPTKMFRDYMDLAEKVKEGKVKKDKAQELLDKDAQERVNQERAMGIDEFGDSNTNLLSSDRLNLQPNILQSNQEGFKDFTQGKQFQKLTVEEKAKTIEQVTREHRSITALKDLAAKLAQQDVQIRNEEQQEFENFLNELDLTQEEKTRAADKFRNDFGNVSMMPTMATGSTINDFTTYRQYKIELLNKLQQKLDRFKIAEKPNYGTAKYKDTIYQYNQTINKLKEDIASLDITDANNVFSDVINEMDYLDSVLDNPNFEAIANQEVIDRVSFLARHIIGRDEDISTPELKWDGSSYTNYDTDVLSKMNNLLNKLSTKRLEIIQSVVDNDIILTEARKNLSKDEFEKLFAQKMKDIGIFEKNFLGINSNDDAITMTLAHTVFQTAIQKNKQQSRESVEALKKFDAVLHDKKFDMDNFFEKDSEGVDTGNLIHKFTTKYFKKIGEYFKLNKEFNDAKPAQKGLVYAKKIALMKNNFEVIDFRKLNHFKAIYGSHPKYSSYFTFSNTEMQDYENRLRSALGRVYDEHIDRVSRKLEEFQDYHIAEEASGNQWSARNIISNSPWEFINNYDSNNSINSIAYPSPSGGIGYVYNNSSFIEVVPKKQVLDVNTNTMRDTGFYNSEFDNIENDNDAFNYWTTIKELYERDINPTYGNVRGLTLGKIERTFAEEIYRSKGVAGFFKVLYSAIKEHAKRIWFDRANYSDKMRIKSNYYDSSRSEIQKITKALNFMSTDEINRRARDLNLTTREESVIRNGLGRLDGDIAVRKYREDVIDRIARKEVFSGYSKDLTKITTALADLASMQRARQDTQFLAELIMKQHESITTDDEKNEFRFKSNEKLRKWINTNIYNDRALGKNKPGSMMAKEKRSNIFMYYTEAEKRLSEILKNVQTNLRSTGDYSFKVGDDTYERNGINYFKFDSNGNRTGITKDVFEGAIENYINEETKNMGIGITPNSVIDGFIKALVYKTFAGNLVSGFFNRSEGMFTNMIMDRSGKFWTPGNRNFAKSFLALANINKIARNRLSGIHRRHFEQLQTYQLLLDELSLFQDKKNELERRDKQSRYNKFKEAFNVFQFAIDNPEFKNQSEIILSMLMDVTIKDKDGNIHKFFDGSSFPAYKPGTLELKDEFKFNSSGNINEDNIGWENFTLNDDNKGANQFFISKLKIEDAIKQTQGNYSNTDSIAFTTKNNWGRLVMLFMRWFPEHFNQRFGKRDVNLIQGKNNQVGRYRGILKSIPATSIFAATAFTISGGPVAGAIAGGLPLIGWGAKAIYSKVFFKESIKSQVFDLKTSLGFLQEMLIQSISFYPKVLYFGKVANKLDGIKNPLIASNASLSESEIGAMKAIAKEAAIMINQLIITILLKAAVWDDDDDKDSVKRKLYYFIDNQGNRMINSLSSWSNISKLWEDNSKFALLRDIKNMYDTIDDLAEDGFTKDTWGTIVKEQPFIPIPNIITNAYFKDTYPGFDKKEYQSSQWFDNMSKSGEWKAGKEYKSERDKFKSYYEEKVRREIEAANPDMSANVLDKAVKSAVRRRLNDSDVSRNSKQDETYKDALNRINFDSIINEDSGVDYDWLNDKWIEKNSPQEE